MSTSTAVVQPLTRQEKIAKLREHWEVLFKRLALKEAYYYPKPVMKSELNGGEVIWLFPTELAKGEDIYTEPVDFNHTPKAERKLYKLRYNPHYKEEYPLVQTRIGPQYETPFAEWEEVVTATELQVSLEDCNIGDLTGRDWACIHLKVPKSAKSWLNNLIKESTKVTT
jgi:hypothetical protein